MLNSLHALRRRYAHYRQSRVGLALSLAQIAPLLGVHYLDAIPAVAMQEAMQQACAVVNCSRSEGLSTALLEAMALGRVVIARRNAGNASLVRFHSVVPCVVC